MICVVLLLRQIELLLRRALFDRERRLFCLVNADLVDYSVSQKAAEKLSLLLQDRASYEIEG